jgi:hypothetical protein
MPVACIGDCNDDGNVSINEVIIGVIVALNGGSVDVCLILDADGDQVITIDELILAVNAALLGCL